MIGLRFPPQESDRRVFRSPGQARFGRSLGWHRFPPCTFRNRRGIDFAETTDNAANEKATVMKIFMPMAAVEPRGFCVRSNRLLVRRLLGKLRQLWRENLISKIRVHPLKVLFVEGYHQVNLCVRSGAQDQCIVCRSANDAKRGQVLYNLDVVSIGQEHDFKPFGDIMLDELLCIRRRDRRMDRQGRENGIEFREGVRSNQSFVPSAGHPLKPWKSLFVSRVSLDDGSNQDGGVQ